MRKFLNNPWIVGALALGAVAFVGQSLLSRPGSGGPPGGATALSTETALPGSDEPPAGRAAAAPADEQNAQSSSTVRRDPFAPAVRPAARMAAAKEQAQPDLVDTVHLSAIWSQGGASYVLLNGRIRQTGDEIGRLRIEAISSDGIWLTHWKGRDHLAIGGDFTLNTPANAPATQVTPP